MKYFLISLAFLLNSCQWIVTHPQEDAEIVEIGEEAIREFYQYESHTLSPTPPQNHEIQQGANGP